MRQTDSILASFPGPVTLHINRRRKVLGLVFCTVSALFWAWILFAEYPQTRGYIRHGSYGIIMTWLLMLGSGALAFRLVLLLLFPSAGSLTLDADGFTIGYVFRRDRKSWRSVSGFRFEATYWPGRIGGSLDQVRYEDLAEAERSGKPKVTRVLPELYGRPRLRGADFAGLMNEWRRRALAQAAEPPQHDAGKSALRHLRR